MIEIYFIPVIGQNPNGTITAKSPAIAYDAAGAVWLKTDTEETNTGWEQRL